MGEQWQVWYTDNDGSTHLADPVATDVESAALQAERLAARPQIRRVDIVTPSGALRVIKDAAWSAPASAVRAPERR